MNSHTEQEGKFWCKVFIVAIILSLVGMCYTVAHGAEVPTTKSCTAVYAMEPKLPSHVAKAWGQRTKFWSQNSVLKVRFLSGTAKQKAEAWKRFQVVDNLVNLQFVQIMSGPSDIRVRFDPGQGHWSYIGTDAKRAASGEKTMNLELKAGLFGDAGFEWDRVAIHEVCHAIGLEHEHQSPMATKLVWNKEAVYAFYAQTQGWSRQQVDFQVLRRPVVTNIVASNWDAKSIMEYPIPEGLANVVVGWNDKLTATDVLILRTIYP